jgi:hypothetical protein
MHWEIFNKSTCNSLHCGLTISDPNKQIIILTGFHFPMNKPVPYLMGLAETAKELFNYLSDNIIPKPTKRRQPYFQKSNNKWIHNKINLLNWWSTILHVFSTLWEKFVMSKSAWVLYFNKTKQILGMYWYNIPFALFVTLLKWGAD